MIKNNPLILDVNPLRSTNSQHPYAIYSQVMNSFLIKVKKLCVGNFFFFFLNNNSIMKYLSYFLASFLYFGILEFYGIIQIGSLYYLVIFPAFNKVAIKNIYEKVCNLFKKLFKKLFTKLQVCSKTLVPQFSSETNLFLIAIIFASIVVAAFTGITHFISILFFLFLVVVLEFIFKPMFLYIYSFLEEVNWLNNNFEINDLKIEYKHLSDKEFDKLISDTKKKKDITFAAQFVLYRYFFYYSIYMCLWCELGFFLVNYIIFFTSCYILYTQIEGTFPYPRNIKFAPYCIFYSIVVLVAFYIGLVSWYHYCGQEDPVTSLMRYYIFKSAQKGHHLSEYYYWIMNDNFLPEGNTSHFFTEFFKTYSKQYMINENFLNSQDVDKYIVSDSSIAESNTKIAKKIDWATINFSMDPYSNPMYFAYYYLNLLRYEILAFLASLFILFVGLFFYDRQVNKFSNDNNDHDLFFRINELLLISIVVNVHFSDTCTLIESMRKFGSVFLFNNLFNIDYGFFLIKGFIVLIFLFFNFFFRFWVFLLSKQVLNKQIDNLDLSLITPNELDYDYQNLPILEDIEKNKYVLPMETSFLLNMLLFFSLLLLSSNDFSILLICLEGLTFITVIFIAFNPGLISATSSIKYFTVSTASSGFLCVASAITYGLLLSLDLKTITDYFYFTMYPTHEYMPVFMLTTLLIFISFYIKLSIFPGNFWVLDIYAGCTIPVLCILVLSKPVYFLVFAKLYFSLYIYCYDFLFPFIVAGSIGSMLFSAYGLLEEQNIKQFVAYSSTGQFGFLLLTFICNSDNTNNLAILLYLFYYVSVMLIFFFAIMNLTTLGNLEKFSDIKITEESNIILFFLVISLLSLAGLPPFFGFFVKVNILLNAAISGLSPVCLLIVLLLNVIMSYGYIRIIRILYFNFSNFNKNSDSTVVGIVDQEKRIETIKYLDRLTIMLIESDFYFKISYFFYFSIIFFFSFLHIFGIYFFGFIAVLLNNAAYIF